MNRPSIGFLLYVLCFSLVGLLPLAAQSAGGTDGSAGPSVLSRYEQGRQAMIQEDWYGAAEAFLEALRLNPAHVDSLSALAECYYQLGEYDQALSWIRKARSLARGDTSSANLEALILIASGQLDSAASVIKDILSREPYNRDALFAAAELDIARGKSGTAAQKYREVVRRYPDDRKALLALALVLGSLGDAEGARSYAARALAQHPDDPKIYYYSAYLDASAGRLDSAAKNLEAALALRPSFPSATALLAVVRYRSGKFEDAARLADQVIAANRNDTSAWYLKGLALGRLGRSADARSILSIGLSIDPQDEFCRAALENLLITTTPVESKERIPLATWHFDRARDYRDRNLSDQALFEYRRGLRVYPYAKDRREYAELLRLQGYPEGQLDQLRFLQQNGAADQAVNDAVEAYDSLLLDALYRVWQVNPAYLNVRHWTVAVFSVSSQSTNKHVDAAVVTAQYLRDLLAHNGNISALDLNVSQPSFSAAFRTAREAGADYFLILSTSESDLDLSLKGSLYVGRTGSSAASFSAYRTGADRLRNATLNLIDQFAASLPFRSVLLQRKAGLALMDKGKADGVKEKDVYDIVKRGSVTVKNEGIGLVYTPDDVVGTLTVDQVDEQVAAGSLTRNGFFDRITAGDEIIKKVAEKTSKASPSEAPIDPELRSLLRALR
jgi:tetratricopeptide (TPR) repeat protein